MHYRSKDYDKATNSFEQLIAVDPRNATAHYYVALCYAQAEESEKSVASLRTAVAIGHPSPDKLAADRELTPLFDNQPKLKAGVDAIVSEELDRQKGILRPYRFDLVGHSRAGVDISVKDFRGAPVAVIFLEENNPESTEAGFVLQGMMQEFPELKIIGIANCPGKNEFRRKSSLDAYARLTGFTFPLVLEKPEFRLRLHPFRAYPTIVALDRSGNARRIVEGKKRDYRELVLDAIRSVNAKPDPKPSKPAGG